MKRATCQRWIALLDEQAMGHTLALEDGLFLRDHARQCRDCGREAELWSTLPGVVADRPIDAAELELAEQQVLTTWSQTLPPPRWWRRRLVAMGAGASAVAAAAALVLRVGLWQSPPAAPAVARAALEGSDRSLAQGDSLQTDRSVECLAIDSGVRACLSPQSRVTFARARMADRVVSLDRGRLVTRLSPQRSGAQFSVRAGAWTISAVGTVFTVEHQSAVVRVRAIEGTVRVRNRSGHSFRLSAPAAVDLTETSKLVPLSTALAAEDLALFGGTAPPASAPPKAAEPAAPEPEDVLGDVEPPRTARPNASVLLQRARALRAEGRYAEAAATYRQLQATHAGSDAARVALLSLGELQLSQLGDARGALRSFQTYLDGRGTLVQEARYGKIRALRSLGRRAEERREIERFLARHPKSVQAPTLRARLDEL